LKASVNSAGTVLTYTLTYTGLSGPAGAAHIHFAQPGVNGSVVLWLCGGGGKPACPAAGVPITGTVNAGDIAALPGVAAQGMVAGDLASVLKAMRARVAYANVHTGAFPGGEIRGQIGGRGKSGNDRGSRSGSRPSGLTCLPGTGHRRREAHGLGKASENSAKPGSTDSSTRRASAESCAARAAPGACSSASAGSGRRPPRNGSRRGTGTRPGAGD